MMTYLDAGHNPPGNNTEVPQMSLDFSRAKRDTGVKSVLDHAGDAWKADAQASILAVAANTPEFTIEDVRNHHRALGLHEPPHHNAWGGVFISAARRGLITKTGRYVQSAHINAHARAVPVWRGAA